MRPQPGSDCVIVLLKPRTKAAGPGFQNLSLPTAVHPSAPCSLPVLANTSGIDMRKDAISKQVNAFPGRLMALYKTEDIAAFRHLEEGGEKPKGAQ